MLAQGQSFSSKRRGRLATDVSSGCPHQKINPRKPTKSCNSRMFKTTLLFARGKDLNYPLFWKNKRDNERVCLECGQVCNYLNCVSLKHFLYGFFPPCICTLLLVFRKLCAKISDQEVTLRGSGAETQKSTGRPTGLILYSKMCCSAFVPPHTWLYLRLNHSDFSRCSDVRLFYWQHKTQTTSM